ncbi:MAG: amidase family protein, partial [Candidatus Limnocylindrales bacterium]
FPLGAKVDDPVAMYLNDACTLPVNVAGLPGLSVPCGLSEGLPVGLQLIGRAWDEGLLFRLGRAYEAVTATADWRTAEPTDLPRLDDPATPAPSLEAIVR